MSNERGSEIPEAERVRLGFDEVELRALLQAWIEYLNAVPVGAKDICGLSPARAEFLPAKIQAFLDSTTENDPWGP